MNSRTLFMSRLKTIWNFVCSVARSQIDYTQGISFFASIPSYIGSWPHSAKKMAQA